MSDTPEKGDRVRFIYEGIRAYDHLVGGGQVEIVHDDGGRSRHHLHGTAAPTIVEILERAPGPAWDPIGTIRAELDDSSVYVKTQDGRWTRVSSRSCEGGFSFAGNELGMSKLIGAVPGTPAAEAATTTASIS